jgi:predicted MFS family arabinose efflux permease
MRTRAGAPGRDLVAGAGVRVRLAGGLDRGTLVVAGVATLGLIMAVLDTTIVNVALDGAGRLDWLGAALLCPGLAGVVFGLSQTESHGGLSAPAAVGPIAAGLALIALFARHSVRVPRALIDLRLFRVPSFRAAAALTFLLGGALFGTLLVLPLYYQLARGQTALHAGLLLAPQGIGAALVLPLGGLLTDRVGGGRVALVGCAITGLATLPLVLVDADTSFVALGAVLFVRGIGLGASIQPATAAAYATLTADAVPRATAALNTLRQIGGSIGTALLAVVLQHEGGMTPAAGAFGHVFTWSAGLMALTLVPAVALARAERARLRAVNRDRVAR